MALAQLKLTRRSRRGNRRPVRRTASGRSFAFNLRFPGQYFDSETGIHYNYYRDGYDPHLGRYLQPDPLLKPNRFLTEELAFMVPSMVFFPQWLHPYTYVTSQPLAEVDPMGLGLLGFVKCIYYQEQVFKYNDECKKECPNDMMGQLKFMSDYKASFLDDALLKCTCTKAEEDGKGELCNKWIRTCIKSGLSLPPRVRK